MNSNPEKLKVEFNFLEENDLSVLFQIFDSLLEGDDELSYISNTDYEQNNDEND